MTFEMDDDPFLIRCLAVPLFASFVFPIPAEFHIHHILQLFRSRALNLAPSPVFPQFSSFYYLTVAIHDRFTQRSVTIAVQLIHLEITKRLRSPTSQAIWSSSISAWRIMATKRRWRRTISWQVERAHFPNLLSGKFYSIYSQYFLTPTHLSRI